MVALALSATVENVSRAADPATQPISDGRPVTIFDAKQYDFISKINGQTYRVKIFRGSKAEVGKPLPVFYLFDGSYYFGTACEAAEMNEFPGIIVGIGYPVDTEAAAQPLRSFDLSMPTAKGDDTKHGGGDAFLRVVEEEVKPLVAARFSVDPSQQILFGHSLGGLMVLRELFRNPQAFSTYVAASPSIWWANKAVLKGEDSFVQRMGRGDLHVRLLITSAGDEEYHGSDPVQLEKAKKDGMVSNASNLAARLEKIGEANLAVTREIIPDETHRSGSIASLARAINFAISKPATTTRKS